ncbi:hypothetical protein SAMN05444365_101833 [Micromonospora pattaloongensis]|uniref:Uncharacterized protein n=1 Tax=Micromonospora pattaloongensis TaxID=405436 RepID=A0A1H3HHB8_9ACTN|nr:DUF2064 domain-containing protein [Micromonospora pattaloongensis]SDY14730.1 hypothetical protein SAMN05444365_101833 [Micromonospora pattaloongensis]
MRPVLLVVAKAPVAGAVKTRLCPPATPAQAAGIAAAALLDTLDVVAATGATAALALTGELRHANRSAGIARALRGWTVFGQRGATFADRLAAAHAEVAARFPGRPVLQLGMDTPHVPAVVLDSALRQLADGAEALLGAATDGGWWALGLRRPDDAVALRTVPMSRPDTGARTARALRDRGLRPRALPVLSDVDTMADALVAAAAVPHRRFAAAVREVFAPTAARASSPARPAPS